MGLFSSKSSSSTTQVSNQYDMRVVGAGGSKNLSAASSTVITPDFGAVAVNGALWNSNVSILDGGAIERSFAFADRISRDAMESASAANNAAIDAVNAAENKLAQAWETSKAGEKQILVGVGLALVAVVAIRSFGKRG